MTFYVQAQAVESVQQVPSLSAYRLGYGPFTDVDGQMTSGIYNLPAVLPGFMST